MSKYESIEFEVKDHVAWITMNRPDVHNAVDQTMQRDLADAWTTVRYDEDVRVAVITGAGDRAFTSGADRDGMDDLLIGDGVVPGGPGAESDIGERIAPKSMGCWKPVIAAVNGIACGGAFYILGESDIVIASHNASFFDPHVTYGMVSAYESMHMLQRMPIGEVIRMQLLGNHERMSVERAHQLGLVSEVVSSQELKSAAAWVASVIASQAPSAIQGTLRAIWAANDMARPVALHHAPHFIGMADPTAWKQGQAGFNERQRIKWRSR